MPRRTVAGDGKKLPLNMRTTRDLRVKLERAAGHSGRSLTQEVERRIELSFDLEMMLSLTPTEQERLREIFEARQ